jgi:hypothetical protein
LLEAGPRWGTLVPVMSRSPDRCSTLERGSPETEPRSCGTQSAHESLFNRRLRVLSPAVRTNDGAVRGGGVKNCAPPLESEHERGEPLSTGQLVKEIFGWQLRVERKPLKSWHYQNVRRALRKVATPIGRASTRGRSVLWQPDERMGLRDRARHK